MSRIDGCVQFLQRLIQTRSMPGEELVDFEQSKPNLEVYSLGDDDFSFHDWGSLEKGISGQLDKQLLVLLKDDIKSLMYRIPIAHEVIAEEKNKGLVIPFNYNDLRAGRGTNLIVTFTNPDDGREGHLSLVPEKFGDGVELKEYITGKVFDFTLRGESIEGEEWYHPLFTKLFGGGQIENAESEVTQGETIQNELVQVSLYDHIGIESAQGAENGNVMNPNASDTDEGLACSPIL